jgi:hypothetical protein
VCEHYSRPDFAIDALKCPKKSAIFPGIPSVLRSRGLFTLDLFSSWLLLKGTPRFGLTLPLKEIDPTRSGTEY